jgi:hypothetical protein
VAGGRAQAGSRWRRATMEARAEAKRPRPQLGADVGVRLRQVPTGLSEHAPARPACVA